MRNYKPHLKAKIFFNRNKTIIRFLVSFVLFFSLLFVCLGQDIFFFNEVNVKETLVNALHVGVCAEIINVLTPWDQVVPAGSVLCGRAMVDVKRGCDGIDGIILLLSALLAFPMKTRWKLIGSMLGLVFMYICNLCRILMLYYALVYKPQWFDFLHQYLGQMFIIASATIFFVTWVGKPARNIDA